MALRDVAIIGHAEVKTVRRSDRDVWELAAELMEHLLDDAGLDLAEVDGLVVSPSISGLGNRYFWPQATADYLGLELDFCELVDLGGSSPTAAVARAAAAINAGLCTTVLALFADCPNQNPRPDDFDSHAFFGEFATPHGQLGPPGAFGILSNRYQHVFGLDFEALGKLAVTQREHALLNENACEQLRTRITVDDYLNSRMIADPVRLLDCVMPCDGGSGLLITSRAEAVRRGVSPFVVPIGYGERTNHRHSESVGDMLDAGHRVAGEAAFKAAGIVPSGIDSFHPYDDFLIAILLQFEMLGFCKRGQGSAFIRETDLLYNGDLPLNTGGGQMSCGQPGGGNGGVNLIEAVRQLTGQAGERQVARTNNAVVTGIGWIPYLRNWTTSVVMVLASDG